MAHARCPYCGRWFKPLAGKGGRQKTCGHAICRARHRRILNEQWWADNPEDRRLRDEKVRNRRREEGYWRKYVASHPDYKELNREQTRERMRQLRARRKDESEVLKDPMKYLEGLGVPSQELFATQELAVPQLRRSEESRPTMFATQELAMGLSVGMWRYLKARERFATQVGADGKAEGTL